MKAHKVKCQICAKGVNIVTYREHGDDSTNVVVVSANLTKEESIDMVARQVAMERTKQAQEVLNEDRVYTPEDIKPAFLWDVHTTSILSHL
jgi:hypothetical protein